MHFGVGNGTLRALKEYFMGHGWGVGGVGKTNQTFFTNAVLIIDNDSCLEQVFSLLS